MTTQCGMDQVNIFFLNEKKSPIVIAPRWDSSLTFLCSFLEKNRSWIDEVILKYGAILVRGFEVGDGSMFERAIKSYQPSLNSTYRGTSPRNLIPGTTSVFSAAEVPVNFPIAQHLEMSFLSAPPRQLYFGCLKESKTAGGETAICNFKQVVRDLPDQLSQKLLQKKLRYTRKQRRIGNRNSHDVSDQKGWPEIFGTTDKEEIKRRCEIEGERVHWDNNDNFISTWLSEPFQLHPITNEPVWFNHSQVFHWSTFPAELFHAFLLTWDIRFLTRSLYLWVLCILKYGMLRQTMSLDITFGDGELLSMRDMSVIRKAIHKNMVYTRWQKGDILILDNFSTSHGRQPTYDKGRKVVVSWSDPIVKANALKNCFDTKSSIFCGKSDVSPKHIQSETTVLPTSEQDTMTETDLNILVGSINNDTMTEDDLMHLNSSRKQSLSIETRGSFIMDPSFWKSN